MIERRPFASLGHADHGWLDARHHFSFAGYHDPSRMGWGALRVWNDDTIAAGTGFPPHGHADMEIVTFVREGAITHQDSLGNVGRTEAGDVQVMSAGSGIRHGEFNREPGPTRIFQLWIVPTERGGAPRWGSRPFPRGDRAGRFVALASGLQDAPDADALGDAHALPIRAAARVAGASIAPGTSVDYALAPGRRAYLVPSTGRVDVNGVVLDTGDGAAVHDEPRLTVRALDGGTAEVVLVDVEG